MATKEQIEAVRSITRTCRGSPIIPVDRQREEYAKVNDILLDRNAEALWKAGRKLALEFKLAPPEPSDDFEVVLREWSSVVGAHREDCGYDFNNVILGEPLDGEVHEYECPRCGVIGTYRAPSFPEG